MTKDWCFKTSKDGNLHPHPGLPLNHQHSNSNHDLKPIGLAAEASSDHQQAPEAAAPQVRSHQQIHPGVPGSGGSNSSFPSKIQNPQCSSYMSKFIGVQILPTKLSAKYIVFEREMILK